MKNEVMSYDHAIAFILNFFAIKIQLEIMVIVNSQVFQAGLKYLTG